MCRGMGTAPGASARGCQDFPHVWVDMNPSLAGTFCNALAKCALTYYEHMPIIKQSNRSRPMPRPKRCRRVSVLPTCRLFKPAGVPAGSLSEVALTVDELEALRLADHEGLYQEKAAERMGVSRQTFGRIVESARNKVARVLVEGLVLRIEGGNVEMAEMRTFQCADCEHLWEVPYGTGRPAECPACQSKNFQRTQEVAVGQAGGQRGGRRRHRCGGPGRQGACRGRGRDRAASKAAAPETRDTTEGEE